MAYKVPPLRLFKPVSLRSTTVTTRWSRTSMPRPWSFITTPPGFYVSLVDQPHQRSDLGRARYGSVGDFLSTGRA
jgi:hypothetical protein